MYSIIQNLNTHTFEQKKEEHVFLKKKKTTTNFLFFWPHARRSKLFQKRIGKFCCCGDLSSEYH